MRHNGFAFIDTNIVIHVLYFVAEAHSKEVLISDTHIHTINSLLIDRLMLEETSKIICSIQNSVNNLILTKLIEDRLIIKH